MDDADCQPWMRFDWCDILNFGRFPPPATPSLYPLGVCLLSIQLLLPGKGARWDGSRAAGDRLQHGWAAGASGGAGRSSPKRLNPSWLDSLWVEVGNRPGTGGKCLKIGINSTRTPRSTFPRWTWLSRFPQMCPVTATASGCGGLSSPPLWSLSLGVSSLSSCGELWNIFGPCAATVTPKRRYVNTQWTSTLRVNNVLYSTILLIKT